MCGKDEVSVAFYSTTYISNMYINKWCVKKILQKIVLNAYAFVELYTAEWYFAPQSAICCKIPAKS